MRIRVWDVSEVETTNDMQWCQRWVWPHQWAFPITCHVFYVTERLKQEVVSPLSPVNGHGTIPVHTTINTQAKVNQQQPRWKQSQAIKWNKGSCKSAAVFPVWGLAVDDELRTDLSKILLASWRLILTPMVCRECWISPASIWPATSHIHQKVLKDYHSI